jgi:hypothetical protein
VVIPRVQTIIIEANRINFKEVADVFEATKSTCTVIEYLGINYSIKAIREYYKQLNLFKAAEYFIILIVNKVSKG